jgi:hypothetical protein
MNYTRTYGWYYISESDRAPAWSSVESLFDFLTGKPEFAEAKRMLKFLDNFVPISPDEIPPTSLLREFIGGSSFKY